MDKHAIIKLKEKGESNRQVAKLLGVNRKTVAKYWNEYIDDLKMLNEEPINISEIQERIVSEPKYDSSGRKRRKFSKQIEDALDAILDSEIKKTKALGPHKQGLTNSQIHGELIAMGFDIGLTTISNIVKEKRQRAKECFIRQSYEFGDRLEFDFGEVKLSIDGKVDTYHLAVLSSPAADFRWAYLYKNQKKDVFLDSHIKFFEMVKGSYKEVVYDNMRNVVTRFIGRNDKDLNEELIKLSLYYGFDINVTNCFKGNEKGHVEGSVKIIRNKVFGPKYQFSSYEEATEYLEKELLLLNQRSTIEDEKALLLPYRPMLELANIAAVTINKYSFARIESNFYSVPDYLVGRKVTAKIYYDKIQIYSNNHFVCEHKKVDGKNKTSIDIRHYLDSLEKKPGALRNSLALKSIPQLKTIYDIYFKSKPKEFIVELKKYKDCDQAELIRRIKNDSFKNKFLQKNESNSEVENLTKNQLALYNNLSIKELH